MSDTDRPMQMISGAYVHLCQCGQWGVYGLTRREASLSVGGAGEHYPHKRPTGAQAEAAEIADMLGTKMAGKAS